MIDKNGKANSRNDEEFCSEGVMVRVVCGLELDKDKVECSVGTDYKKNLHGRIVRGHEVCDKVEITCCEHQSKENLTLARDTLGRMIVSKGSALI